jgi:virulence-associated protein VagC
MGVTSFEAVVENGQIRLPADVRLPEKARVYVIAPGVELPPTASIVSPRLLHPEQAEDFKMEVVEER